MPANEDALKSRMIQGDPSPGQDGRGGRADEVQEALPVVDIRTGSTRQPPDDVQPLGRRDRSAGVGGADEDR